MLLTASTRAAIPRTASTVPRASAPVIARMSIAAPARKRAAAGEVETEEIESVPPKLLVTKVVGEKAFGGTRTFEIGPAGRGSTLTITERGEVYNPIFRFVSRFVMGHHRTTDAYLSRLRRRFAA